MKKTVILVLVCILFFLSGCGGEYPAEKLYWKAGKFSEQIFRNPKGTPSSQYDRAISAFRKVVRKYPDSEKAKEAQLKIGDLYAAWENFPQAIKEFEKAIQKYPGNTILCSTAQFAIGTCYEKQENWKEALVAYRKLFTDYQNTSLGLQVPLYIAQYYQRNEETKETNEAFRQAIKDYKKIVSEHPKSKIAYIAQDYIAICYFNLKQWHEAINTLEKLIKDYPESPKAAQSLLTMAGIYRNQLKQPQKAIAIYRQFLKEYPDSKLTHTVRKVLEESEKK